MQAAREAARRVQCCNHLKQMGLAALDHEHVHKILPTGGWGWGWAGDPDRGFYRKQPGGWHYNILPYLEQETLHNMGKNKDRVQGKTRVENALSVFHCPSRRPAIAYPYVHGTNFANVDRPSVIGRSDYAGNAGDVSNGVPYGPGSLSEGDGWTEAQWSSLGGSEPSCNGVILLRGEVALSSIKDGTSTTYLFGERYLNPDRYRDGVDCDNDQGWDIGLDYDGSRWTNIDSTPRQDTAGLGGCSTNFGSAHPSSFQMACCDGSVHGMSYSIDPTVHRLLGNRVDGQSISPPPF